MSLGTELHVPIKNLFNNYEYLWPKHLDISKK